MRAFSAAASDEDGDIISALREKLGRAHALCRIRSDRIRELEAMLYAVGAGGVGEMERPPVVKESLTVEQSDSDTVPVPRSLLGAACAAINRKQDAPRLLEQLRRYTTGDLSKPPVVEQEPVAELHSCYKHEEPKQGCAWCAKAPSNTHPQPRQPQPPVVEQEPVAVIGDVWTLLWAGGGPIADIVKKHGLRIGDCLYTHPQPIQPLTDDKIHLLWNETDDLIDFARAIERAHKIGGEA